MDPLIDFLSHETLFCHVRYIHKICMNYARVRSPVGPTNMLVCSMIQIPVYSATTAQFTNDITLYFFSYKCKISTKNFDCCFTFFACMVLLAQHIFLGPPPNCSTYLRITSPPEFYFSVRKRRDIKLFLMYFTEVKFILLSVSSTNLSSTEKICLSNSIIQAK